MSIQQLKCPVCQTLVPDGATHCPDCGEDLVALVHLVAQSQIAFNQGLMLSKGGNLEGATHALLQSVTANPTNFDAMNLLGKVYALQGLEEKARATWQKVLMSEPANSNALTNIAHLQAITLEREERSKQVAVEETKDQDRVMTRARRRTILLICISFLLGLFVLSLIGLFIVPGKITTSVAETAVVQSWSAQTREAAINATSIGDMTRVAQNANLTVVAMMGAAKQTVAAVAVVPTPVVSTAVPLILTAQPSPTQTPLPDLVTPVKQALLNRPEIRQLVISVEQDGMVVRLKGNVTSLVTRLLIENVAHSAGTPGIIDVQGLLLTNVYEVQPGDNLWDIATRVYGSPIWARTIARLNNLTDPSHLATGQKLMLPSVGQ